MENQVIEGNGSAFLNASAQYRQRFFNKHAIKQIKKTVPSNCIQKTLTGTAQASGQIVSGCQLPSNINDLPIPCVIKLHPNYAAPNISTVDADGRYVGQSAFNRVAFPRTIKIVKIFPRYNRILTERGDAIDWNAGLIKNAVYDTGTLNDNGDYQNASGAETDAVNEAISTKKIDLIAKLKPPFSVTISPLESRPADWVNIVDWDKKGDKALGTKKPVKAGDTFNIIDNKPNVGFGFLVTDNGYGISGFYYNDLKFSAAPTTSASPTTQQSTPQKHNPQLEFVPPTITPTWMKILPIIGFAAGAYTAHKMGAKDGSKATVGQYLAFASIGAWVLTAPILFVSLRNIQKLSSVDGIAKNVKEKK